MLTIGTLIKNINKSIMFILLIEPKKLESHEKSKKTKPATK